MMLKDHHGTMHANKKRTFIFKNAWMFEILHETTDASK